VRGAAVLHSRVERWARAAGPTRRTGTDFIAGLIRRAVGVHNLDMARALDERDQAMQRRAQELAQQAVAQDQVWVHRLGAAPANPARRHQWIEAVSTIAAYRDRWDVGNDARPLGSDAAVTTTEGRDHRRLAEIAVSRAHRLSNDDHERHRRQQAAEPPVHGHQLSAGVEL
jgi:hypothetical protein